MRKMSLGAVLAIVPVLLAGCQTAPSTVATVKATATVAPSPAVNPTTQAIPCGHPVVTHPKFTAEEEFFPKGALARRFVGNFALVRTMDDQVGLNPLFLSSTSRTKHPAFDGHPFNINVVKAVGNTVTITVPKDLTPHSGTPINGIDSSEKSVAKHFPPVVQLPDNPMVGPISTMHVGDVRHALDMSVFADENGCYYLDTRGSSWTGQIGMPDELAITRTSRGYDVVSATANWKAFYPVRINKVKGVAVSPVAKQAEPRPAVLPRPVLPKCPNQYSYPIKSLTGRLVGSDPVCVMVGISFHNLKRTTVTLTVHTPSCGPQPPAATTTLQGTGSKTLVVVKPGCGSGDSYSLNYSRRVPEQDVLVRAATEFKD